MDIAEMAGGVREIRGRGRAAQSHGPGGTRKGQEERLQGGPRDRREARHSVLRVCRTEWPVPAAYPTARGRPATGPQRPGAFGATVRGVRAPQNRTVLLPSVF